MAQEGGIGTEKLEKRWKGVRVFHSQNGIDDLKFGQNMGVSKNRGTPKWMVYNGKPY